MSELHDVPVTTIDGREATLGDWAGHVLLIVNTASGCGCADQYGTLQELWDEYSPRGFYVLGFPCTQFGGQEPGSDEEIASVVGESFGVTFPMFARCDVAGADAHPLFQLLAEQPDADGEAGDVKWNFEKFVVSDSGDVVGRFRSDVEPDDDAIIEVIEQHLPV